MVEESDNRVHPRDVRETTSSPRSRVWSEGGQLHATWANGHREALPSSRVALAHLGCQLLKNVKVERIPARIRDRLEQAHGRRGWRGATVGATNQVGAVLAKALTALSEEPAAFIGVSLIDTMRGGSDYWRPGNLLSAAADTLRELRPSAVVEYLRYDELCPPRELLDRFRASRPGFGAYAAEYAAWLRADGGLELGLAVAVMSLARGLLPVLVCTDPYVPGYLPPGSDDLPYAKRPYPTGLEELGCHRVVLAEELSRRFASLGVAAKVLGLDPSHGLVHRERWETLTEV